MSDRAKLPILLALIVFSSMVLVTCGTRIGGHPADVWPWLLSIANVANICILVCQAIRAERRRYELALKFSRRAFSVSDDGAAMVGTSPITSIKPGIGGITVVPVITLGGGGGGQTKSQASSTAIIQGGFLVSGPTLRR